MVTQDFSYKWDAPIAVPVNSSTVFTVPLFRKGILQGAASWVDEGSDTFRPPSRGKTSGDAKLNWGDLKDDAGLLPYRIRARLCRVYDDGTTPDDWTHSTDYGPVNPYGDTHCPPGIYLRKTSEPTQFGWAVQVKVEAPEAFALRVLPLAQLELCFGNERR